LIVCGITLNLVSCAVSPPDVPVFSRINATTGYYIYTISTKEGYVNDTDKLFFDKSLMKEPQTFSQIVKKSLIIPTFSYEKINTYISDMCFKYKQKCTDANSPETKIPKVNKVQKIYGQDI
jgi:hypothetical protein